jgi:hypothetical protein
MENIFDFFSIIATYEVSRLARNVHPAVQKKCCYSSEQFYNPGWLTWFLIEFAKYFFVTSVQD